MAYIENHCKIYQANFSTTTESPKFGEYVTTSLSLSNGCFFLVLTLVCILGLRKIILVLVRRKKLSLDYQFCWSVIKIIILDKLSLVKLSVAKNKHAKSRNEHSDIINTRTSTTILKNRRTTPNFPICRHMGENSSASSQTINFVHKLSSARNKWWKYKITSGRCNICILRSWYLSWLHQWTNVTNRHMAGRR